MPVSTKALTILLITLYALLGAVAGVCQGGSLSPAMEHHQHGQAHHGSSVHAALCVLACQANSSSSLISSMPDDRPMLLFLCAIAASFAYRPLLQQDRIRARAPPCPSSSR
jgi:hypothetical protein